MFSSSIPAVGGPITTSWDASHLGGTITLSGNNLIVTSTSNVTYGLTVSTIGKTTGKWYWEIYTTTMASSADGNFIGVAINPGSIGLNSFVGHDANGWGYESTGSKWHTNAALGYGGTWVHPNVLQVALDMTNGFVYAGINNTWQNSGVPTSGATGTGAMYGSLTGTVFAAIAMANTGDVLTANFGASAFSFTPPVGYSSGLF